MSSYFICLVSLLGVAVKKPQDKIFGRAGNILPLLIWELYLGVFDLIEQLSFIVRLKRWLATKSTVDISLQYIGNDAQRPVIYSVVVWPALQNLR